MKKPLIIITRDAITAIRESEHFEHPVIRYNDVLGVYAVMERGADWFSSDTPPPPTGGGRVSDGSQEPA